MAKATKFRIVSKAFRPNGVKVVVESGWMSYYQCRRAIRGRHGHIPPFTFPSSIADEHKLQRKYGS